MKLVTMGSVAVGLATWFAFIVKNPRENISSAPLCHRCDSMSADSPGASHVCYQSRLLDRKF